VVPHRQLGGQRVRFEPASRAWPAALLHPQPRPNLHRLRLSVRPNTILHWHRDLHVRRHAAASRRRRRGRPRAIPSLRVLLLPTWAKRLFSAVRDSHKNVRRVSAEVVQFADSEPEPFEEGLPRCWLRRKVNRSADERAPTR
jgi:hypothetical protein